MSVLSAGLPAGAFWILGERVLNLCPSCAARPVVTLVTAGAKHELLKLQAECRICKTVIQADNDIDLMVAWNQNTNKETHAITNPL